MRCLRGSFRNREGSQRPDVGNKPSLRPPAADFTGEIDTIHRTRQCDIGNEKDRVVAHHFHHLQGGFAAFTFDDLNVGFFEDGADQFTLIDIVFDDQRHRIAMQLMRVAWLFAGLMHMDAP